MNPNRSPGRVSLRALFIAAVVSMASLAPSAAFAWGPDGHRLVATVAEGRLSAPAKAEAQRLLALEPGATLASISTWADETRDPATAAWHYVNFPRGGACSYDPGQICTGGACVVAAIEQQVAILASKAPDAQRLLALKYVVHFVGDVHQPLHAGYADDRGGNSYQLQAFELGTNLHALWDSGLLRNWPGGLSALQARVTAEAGATGGMPATWAEASCRIVSMEGFYPPTHVLEADYPQRFSATLVQQLASASRRLANLLNVALVPDGH